MRPLTLDSMAEYNFGLTVPTTSSTATCGFASVLCALTCATGRLMSAIVLFFSPKPVKQRAHHHALAVTMQLG